MANKTPRIIDLNAARREAEVPDGLPVVIGEDTYLLPAELPADIFDPFLSEDLDLVGLIKPFLEDEEDSEESIGDVVVALLTERPSVPADLLKAIHDTFALLFGEEPYADFRAKHKPSINDYARLLAALVPAYGVSLGEAFASPTSSETAGATPKPTSSPSTDSTPAKPGARRKPAAASSESDASAA